MSKKERYCIKHGKLYDRDVCVGYISEYQDETYVDMLNYVEEQLTEKDKEIEKLKAIAESVTTLKESGCKIEDFVMIDTKQIRHQICEKIKRTLYDNWRDMKLWWMSNGKCIELEEILDQIEKGE